jgi:hypothetical protein
MNLNFDNPLQPEHIVLLDIRRAIKAKDKDCRIEIGDRQPKGEYTTVQARIVFPDGSSTSWCQGQSLNIGSPINSMLRAEIVSLVMAAVEIGVEFSFKGEPVDSIPEVAEIATRTRFDHAGVEACITMPRLYNKMKELGLDTEQLKEGLEALKASGKIQRITVGAAADFLYPKGVPASYIKVEKPKSKVKKAAPEEPFIPVPVEKKKPARSGDLLNEMHQRLSEAGVTNEVLKERNSEYKTVISFAIYASEEQVNEVLDSLKIAG